MKKLIIFAACFLVGFSAIAQDFDSAQQEVNVDDLGDVSDVFQENFFEALKQKAIENYERAITALKVCLQSQPNNAVVHFEMGKNYNFLKEYDTAEGHLKQALSFKPDNEDILKELYDVQFNKQDWEGATQTVQKLIKSDIFYKEDLAKLYQRTKDYDKALEQLDELDEEQGGSFYRENLRKIIYRQSDNKQAQALVLEKRINAEPDNLQNYLNLIFIYSDMGADEKAFQTALKLQQTKPDADLAHMALYKGYLDKGQVGQAIASMKIVLKSNQVDKETKGKVLKDFMQYSTENPEVSEDLNEVLSNAENSKDPKALALFYLKQKDKINALLYFEQALSNYPTDYEVFKNLALLQIDTQKFTEAKATTEKALSIFPSQPLLYLLQGVACNNLGEFKDALKSLEFGIDYVIDDPKMEADIFKQMSQAYQGLGNNTKALEFQNRADKANKQAN